MNIPDELKIAPPDWRDVAQAAREVAQVTKESNNNTGISGSPTAMLPENVEQALVALAISAWRIRTRLNNADKELRAELSVSDIRKLNRYCDAMFESLSGIGLEVKDRTGEAFDYGLPEKVVTAQPQVGLAHEVVIETLRPTICWNSRIAPGEVVIGVPPDWHEGKQL